MKNYKQSFTPAVAITFALVLTACGGGGSDTAASAASTTTTLSSITSSNSTAVSANAFTAAEALNNTASSSSSFVTGVTLDATSANVLNPAIDLINFASNNSPKMVTGVTQTQACPSGGTVTVSGTIQNSNGLTNGDNVTFSTNSCVINGISLNGGFSVLIGGLTGTISSSTQWAANLAIQFNKFAVTSATEGISVDGDLALRFSQTTSTNRSFSLSGNALRAVLTRSGVQLADRTLQSYSGSLTLLSPNVTTSINYSLTGSSSALGQFNFTVKTLQPFVRAIGAFPSSGSLIVTGAVSSVTLTAIDSTNVRLDFSAKGDGVITQTTTTTWAQLKASI